jgi:WD40 repeat protein
MAPSGKPTELDGLPLVAFDTGNLLLETGAIVPAAAAAESGFWPRSLHATTRVPLYGESPDLRPKREQRGHGTRTDTSGVSGECVRILDKHSDAVFCCDWSRADGGRRFVLSGSGDSTLRVWDLEAGLRSNCTRVLKGHTGAVWCCQFSPRDGGRRWAVSGSRDKTLRIFDAETGDCVSVLEGHQGSVQACAWSMADSAGVKIVSGSTDKSLKIWACNNDSRGWMCTATLLGHSEAVMCAVWSAADGGGRWILSGSDDTTVRLWDAHSATQERVLKGHSAPVLCCAFSTAGGGRRWALSGSWDTTVNLWDCCALLVQNQGTNTQTSLVLNLRGHTAPVFCCSFSEADEGNRWALTGAYDQTLRIWALMGAFAGSCVCTLEGHSRWVRACAFSNAEGGKRWLLSGSRDKTLRVWEVCWDGKDSSDTADDLRVEAHDKEVSRAAPSSLRAVAPSSAVMNAEHEMPSYMSASQQLVESKGAAMEHAVRDVVSDNDMTQRLAQAEQETQSVRQLLQAKHLEAESFKLRCDELEAEVEALVRSLGASKQISNELQQRVLSLEAELTGTRAQAHDDVVSLREENEREQQLMIQEFSLAQESKKAEVARVMRNAKAEAELAVENAMAEISKVSLSNDRLAAEIGDLQAAREECRQVEAELARRRADLSQRELALQAREDSVDEVLRENVRLRAEQANWAHSEKDAELIRTDAADAAREVADRMSESMGIHQTPDLIDAPPAGKLSSPREGSVIVIGSLGSCAQPSLHHTTNHRMRRLSNPAGAIRPSQSPEADFVGPPSVLSSASSFSSSLASLSPPASFAHDGLMSPPDLGGGLDGRLDGVRKGEWVATRRECIAGPVAGHASGATQVLYTWPALKRAGHLI